MIVHNCGKKYSCDICNYGADNLKLIHHHKDSIHPPEPIFIEKYVRAAWTFIILAAIDHAKLNWYPSPVSHSTYNEDWFLSIDCHGTVNYPSSQRQYTSTRTYIY
jgi:hypothetical protein